jgi:hypothetical protein
MLELYAGKASNERIGKVMRACAEELAHVVDGLSEIIGT